MRACPVLKEFAASYGAFVPFLYFAEMREFSTVTSAVGEFKALLTQALHLAFKKHAPRIHLAVVVVVAFRGH